MLKTRLFAAFMAVILLFGLLSTFVGVRTIRRSVIGEAQKRVRLDLSSAWAVYDSRMREIEIVLKLVASKQLVGDDFAAGTLQDPELRARLERLRVGFGLDFLDLVALNGQVQLRTSSPYATGDYLAHSEAVAAASKGNAVVCMAVLSRAELEREGDGLADLAFIGLEETLRARRTARTEESRGMAMVGAVPVQRGAQVIGVVYGGMLINRREDFVDKIQDVIYKNESYNGTPLGTTTLFLDDCRVATTVRCENGNRAIGTRASKEVADRVLDNGAPWVGEAFVVRDWYLTAYDPIRDCGGRVIGMLYVGILKRPFQDNARRLLLTYVGVSLFVLLVGLVLAFVLASRVAQPIHRLVQAAQQMSQGEKPPPVPQCNSCHETDRLIGAFNQMAAALAEREERLKALNREYMETLGFVSHELKSPVATIMNYVYLLGQQKLGPLTEKQDKAVRAVDASGRRLVEMVRHYLNLSRIENHEWQPVRAHVAVRGEIVAPVVESMESDLEARRMTLRNDVPEDLVLNVDRNMLREVFENLIGNAIKYGREGGAIRISASPENGFACLGVRNEGEGIPPEKAQGLFRKFSRLEGASGARHEKGTGLGLFITKHIVESHGGTIEVESRMGEWVEFRFTLPREPAAASGVTA